MDLTESIIPKSDQINAEDLLTGPQTFTIKEVRKGNSEQPVNVQLVELPGRPYRPSKSMRRIMVGAWGKDTEPYAGRRITLYRDPDVKFGSDVVGGLKISHMSHIDGQFSMPLTETRGKRKIHTVQPLIEQSSAPTLADRITSLVAAFGSGGITQAQLEAKVAQTVDQWTEQEVGILGELFSALKSGTATKAEEFPTSDEAGDA